MKYIVEFEDEPCMYEDEVHFYKCIQAPWWGLSERVIEQLTPYQPDIAPDTNVGNITNSCAHEKDHNADIGKKAEKEDCISRRAAIEALDEWFKKAVHSRNMSAYEYDSAYTQGEIDAYVTATDTLKTLPAIQTEPHWIPCSERLPETYGAYLVQDVCGTIFADYWRGYWLAKTTMVAWRPLPEPYKGGEK